MIKNRNEFLNTVKSWPRRMVAGVTGLVMTMAFSVGMSGNYQLGYDAYIGDTFVATLDSFEEGDALIESVEQQYGVTIDGGLNYYLRLVEKDGYTNPDAAKENIKSTDAHFVAGSNIMAGDTVLCKVASRTEAAETLLAFASQFNEEGAATQYDKEIYQQPAYVPIDETVSAAEAKAVLEANVTATSIVTTTVTETIAYLTQSYDDATMEVGKSLVTQEGVNGEKEVTYRITKVNGAETGRDVIAENIITQPQTKVVYNGTKKSGVGTGTFANPTKGSFSSSYGIRWNRQHKGIDIANSVGTAIYAADSGKVIYSGWMSGYGNLVQIDHANGYVTYYAHCSSVSVKVGDIVSKGDYIAAMGSTGNSTGSHLHFEIRKNGVPQNPTAYVNY